MSKSSINGIAGNEIPARVAALSGYEPKQSIPRNRIKGVFAGSSNPIKHKNRCLTRKLNLM